MKDWLKWGLAGAIIGFVIEVLTFGNFQFVHLAPIIENKVMGPILLYIIGDGYLPGEAAVVILTLYVITGVIIGKIISKFWSKRG